MGGGFLPFPVYEGQFRNYYRLGICAQNLTYFTNLALLFFSKKSAQVNL